MRKRVRPRTTHGGAARPPARAAGLVLGVTVAAAIGCAIGSEPVPGCNVDADCDEGFVCKSGACFRTTTGHTPPEADGGDAGG